jgi:hypothetical protein
MLIWRRHRRTSKGIPQIAKPIALIGKFQLSNAAASPDELQHFFCSHKIEAAEIFYFRAKRRSKSITKTNTERALQQGLDADQN